MLGIFAYEDEGQVKASEIRFVSIPKEISDNPEAIKIEFSKEALAFANHFDKNKIFLIYGKDGKIVYDY